MGSRDWVIWSDVGNVLAPFFLERYYRNLSGLTGLAPEEVKRRLYGFQSAERIHLDILTGALEMDAYRRGVELLLSHELPAPKFWPAFNDIFDANHRLVDVFNLLRRTCQVKRIILMTDADPQRLKHSMVLCGFKPDDIVASYEVGCRKPGLAMFSKGLELAASDPDRIVYLDDVRANVLAARELGVQSLLFMYDEVGVHDANSIAFSELRELGFDF